MTNGSLQYIDPFPVIDWFNSDAIAGDAPALGLSQSKANVFCTCKMKFYWQHCIGLKPKRLSNALKIGAVTHYLLAEYYRRNKSLSAQHISTLQQIIRETYADDESNSLDIAATAGRLVVDYIHRFKNENIEIIAVEQLLKSKQIIGDNFYFLHGTVDAVVKFNDKQWQFEHKTTARYDELYLKGLRNALQAKLYHVLLLRHDFTPVGVLYNLLVKKSVPDYFRQPILMPSQQSSLVLETFDGIANELFSMREKIKNGLNPYKVFYPAFGQCVQYSYDCDYKVLCNKLNDPTQLKRAIKFFNEQ